MKTRHVLAWSAVAIGLRLAAAPTIEAQSAAQWKACPGWVSKPPATYAVTESDGLLVFSAEGAGTEMAWILAVSDRGPSGDERYLLVRYRARGLSTRPGVYFLHGEEGTRGGRAYALADQLVPDGQWHTLAVDLVAINPLEVTYHLAVKVAVSEAGVAELALEKFWFDNALPAGARLAELPPQPPDEQSVVDWRQAGDVRPQPGWTTAPAADTSATLEGSAMAFAVSDAGRGMRWLLGLAKPVDTTRLPYLSLRYRFSGQPGQEPYAIWLGDQSSGTGGNAVVAVQSRELTADGGWHRLCVKLEKRFQVTQLAVGLDCLGPDASLVLDTLVFSSRQRRWALAETVEYEIRSRAWPAGAGGFVTAPATVAGGQPSAFLLSRLELTDWFTAPEVTVAGVPFVVETDPSRISQTATARMEALSVALPAAAREICLLVAAAAPATEPWGIDWAHPRPVEVLDVPEKVLYEVCYAEGPPDWLLPLDAATGTWGLRRGVSVSVVHPDPTRQATELRLHDRMQTASLAIAGVTIRHGEPRVAEPDWAALSYAPPPPGALTALGPLRSSQPGFPLVAAGQFGARFAVQPTLRWATLSAGADAETLACAEGPVFEVSLGGATLPPEAWQVERFSDLGQGFRFILRQAASGLVATMDCLPGAANEVLMRLDLRNEGTAPVTATLRFPVLTGVRLGSAADTWYLAGKRGGIVNSVAARFRDPLGERHPLQVDGFFNPKLGLALACLTHDSKAQHHFIDLGKTATGGSWSAEYVERDLAPGQSFRASEAALVLREGDWRAIMAAYREWLATWFVPPAPKPWFESAFALVSSNVHYDAVSDARARGAIQPSVDTLLKHIGVCDYVHRFGWGASKVHGEWGDYTHYDEIGGLEYFRENIRAVQESGIAVSLYLDGYLSCEQGQAVGRHAREWAMQRADGSPQFVPEYQAYNQCPYNEGWQQHLSETYRRVQNDLGPKILYVDEYGATDGRWLCRAKDHGHNSYEIPYAGEVAMLERIRTAVGPEVALYTEYPPAEVSRQIVDGSITYQALWSVDQEPLAPHFIDLPRFVFPAFKQFHIIYYVPNRAGNWWLLKFPFFNGEVYRIGEPNLAGMDEPSLAFLRRAVRLQCAHREAFSSHDVEPLTPTEVRGVFANRFAAARETVWTLYNANGRSERGPLLRVPHAVGATYEDAWNGQALAPAIEGEWALVALDLGPKAIGCLVQRRP
jgi:hypothetical protein